MDSQYITCPHCHSHAVVEVDVTATAQTKGELTFPDNKDVSDIDNMDCCDVDDYDMSFDYDYGGYHCGNCGKYLDVTSVVVGRNEYLNEARQEEKELAKEEGQPCLF